MYKVSRTKMMVSYKQSVNKTSDYYNVLPVSTYILHAIVLRITNTTKMKIFQDTCDKF